MKMVNVTPGLNRIFSYELRNIEEKEQLKIKDDNAIAFSCPKLRVECGGAVRTSEFMQMQHTQSLLVTAEENYKLEEIKSALEKIRIKLMDTLKLYEISS